MKTKVLNFLLMIKKVLLYTIISGIIFEILVLTIPIRIIINLPNALDIYNYVLAVIATLFLFGMIFLPSNKNETVPHNKKNTKKVKGTWVFKFRGLEFPIRFLVFAIIGFLAGVYFLSSFLLVEDINVNLNFIILLVLLFFGIAYLLSYFFFIFFYVYMVKSVFILIQKILGVETDYQINELEETHKRLGGGGALALDVISYYIGGFAGLCFVGLIAALVAIVRGVILLVKGITWLIHNPNPWGILALSVIVISVLVYFSYKKSMREIDGYLKNPGNTFNNLI
ncbi:MAG: hypothetical protein ACP5NZ_01760 [Nanobdellota archaeon]